MTGSCRVLVKRSAERELPSRPRIDLRRIVERIRRLAEVPRPPGAEKLSEQDQYRIRQGDYRIVYRVGEDQRVVEIVKIGHRREVYRDI